MGDVRSRAGNRGLFSRLRVVRGKVVKRKKLPSTLINVSSSSSSYSVNAVREKGEERRCVCQRRTNIGIFMGNYKRKCVISFIAHG